MKKSTKKLLLALELLLILLLAIGAILYQRYSQEQDTASLSTEDQKRRYMPSVSYQGDLYPLKRNLSSLLLIGTDNTLDDGKQAVSERYHYNNNLADFLVILVFDNSAKTVTPFQICRDTMCEVSRVDTAGMPIDSAVMQITRAHAYGKGKADSAELTRAAVENLLFGIPIDNYLRFTMDAVPLLNDLVGGVTVRLESDVPALGPEYVKGNVITLKGQDALRFVRYRNTELMDSNLTRMANHRLYLEGFTAAARKTAAKDPELAVKTFQTLDPFLCTDLSVERVQDIVDRLVNYEILPVVTPAGEYDHKEGETYPGFYVDEASLWSCVKSTFCA